METLDTVLVDCGSDRTTQSTLLERLGHHVEVCPGPANATLCPILKGEFCEKVAAASGVIFDLDLDRAQHRAILAEYQEILGPDIPIRAVVRPEDVQKYAELLAGVQVWTHEPTASDIDGFAALVESIEDRTEV